jgi:hypothetical protein
MTYQKIQRDLKPITPVTSFQLIAMFLFMGIAAGVFASFVLGVQDRLRGGIGLWGAFLMLSIVFFAGSVIGYLKFKHKDQNISINPRNHRLKTTRPLFTSKQ